MKSIKRIFIPGSEWVYFKIYAGYKSIDNILAQEVSLIIKDLTKTELIEKWFFCSLWRTTPSPSYPLFIKKHPRS